MRQTADELRHAKLAIEELTKERELYRMRWLASEVDLRLAREALKQRAKDGSKTDASFFARMFWATRASRYWMK